jgi:hypothetical protein
LAGEDSLFEQVLGSPYTDLLVIDLDGGDEGLQISLPEGHRPGGQVLLHHTTETLDQRWVDLDLGRQMPLGPFQGSLRPITIRLKTTHGRRGPIA